jgi:peptide/nickel transport system substrate-binding protein
MQTAANGAGGRALRAHCELLPPPQGARALLKEAGVANPSFTLVTTTTSDAQRLALVVQAMARDAGFDVKIQATEFATSLNMADKGDFEAYVLAWSGRADPDGYCSADTDALLKQARSLGDVAARKKAYEQVARAAAERAAHHLPVPPANWLRAYNPTLSGVRNVPDGLLRLSGLKLGS